MRKNLLIGAITNYGWDDIAPFFNSYVQAGFENCECVMFTGGMLERTVAKMRSCGVNVRPIPEELLSGRIINTRWKIYADFLKNNPDKYNMVFTADLRDVIFQQDVFKFYDSGSSFLGIAIEDPTLTQSMNQYWLVNAYGQEVYETIKNERVICLGTIWGTPDKFIEFSEIMLEKLSSEWASSRNVIDQALANYLIYHDKMFAGSLIPSTNYDGYIMTIGQTDAKDVHTDSSGNVLNGKGQIAAVVHQYDRKPQIIESVISKYGEGMSKFAKFRMRHFQDKIGLVLRFITKVKQKGILGGMYAAVKYIKMMRTVNKLEK